MRGLKRCPFCGGYAHIENNEDELYKYEVTCGMAGSIFEEFYVVCSECGARTGACPSKETAKMMWNERKENK